ncbi:MAG: tail fiber domain-containing protein [Ramlibacter sp.]|nr:tail fiber domain-containing protein [Ramlibacter sp.]
MAASQVALSKEQLDWAKQLWRDSEPERQAASARSAAVSDAQLESMRTSTALAQDYADYQKQTFRPLERQIIDEAKNYDSEANQAQAAGRAVTDVRSAFGGQRDMAMRSMTRAGFNPADGQVAAMQGILDSQEALGVAAGANNAREQVKTVGRAMRQDAVNLGRGLASNQATAAGLALTAGNSSASNAQIPIAATAAGANIMNNGFSGAQAGLGSAGNIYSNSARIQQQGSDNSGAWGALGNVAGALIVSDVAAKKGIQPVDPDQALEAVEKTPVSDWTYKDGQGDGRSHTGPMAQDAKANMGEAAAPGGKKIDLVTMNGINMAAIQALSRKVAKVAAAAGVAELS